jgi:hypothetical protein
MWVIFELGPVCSQSTSTAGREMPRERKLSPRAYAARREKERKADTVALALYIAIRTLRAMRYPPDDLFDAEEEIAAMKLLLVTKFPCHLARFDRWRSCSEGQDGGNIIRLSEWLTRGTMD